jgi:hypothetical protein
MERNEGHNKLMRSYFVDNPILPKNVFLVPFRMGIKLLVMKFERFFKQRKNTAGELVHRRSPP